MNRLVLTNIGRVLSGRLDAPELECDYLVAEDGVIRELGRGSARAAGSGPGTTTIDCGGMSIAPTLVDTHGHPTFGDYTPRINTSGYLENMVHGGVGRLISAGELHVEGRSGTASNAFAIALAAKETFSHFRPLGLRVMAGALLIEADTTPEHIAAAAAAGITHLGEVGCGSLKDVTAGKASVREAIAQGMKVIAHTGGTSSRADDAEKHPGVTADEILEIEPTVAAHTNGGYIPPSDEDIRKLLDARSGPYLEIVHVGSVPALIDIVQGLAASDQLDRLLIGNDAPTGFGTLPLGILSSVAVASSLGGIGPERAWAVATGNAAKAFDLHGHQLEVGMPADIVVFDTGLGSSASDGIEAVGRGEIPGIAAVIIDGTIRLLGSRNTTRATRKLVVDSAIS